MKVRRKLNSNLCNKHSLALRRLQTVNSANLVYKCLYGEQAVRVFSIFSETKNAGSDVEKHAVRARICILKNEWKRPLKLQSKPSHRKRNSTLKRKNKERSLPAANNSATTIINYLRNIKVVRGYLLD